VIALPAATANDCAAATGAAAIAVAAAPAMNSGAMNLSFPIMYPVYHFPVNQKRSFPVNQKRSRAAGYSVP
jgi:hypothetical protein